MAIVLFALGGVTVPVIGSRSLFRPFGLDPFLRLLPWSILGERSSSGDRIRNYNLQSVSEDPAGARRIGKLKRGNSGFIAKTVMSILSR